MNDHEDSGRAGFHPSPSLPEGTTIPHLIARIYAGAAVADQCRILGHFMQPLGVFSLAVIENGVFARIRFRSGWHKFRVRAEDVAMVRASEVVDLVRHAEQVSAHAIETLPRLLAACSAIGDFTACELLITTLRARNAPKNGTAPDVPENCPRSDETLTMAERTALNDQFDCAGSTQ